MIDPWSPLILVVTNIAVFQTLCWVFGSPQ